MIKKLFKIPYINLLPMIILSLISYRIISNPELLLYSLNYLLEIFTYLIWGCAIAYFLRPMLNYLEKQYKLKRGLAITFTYLIFVIFCTFIGLVIFPFLAENITGLVNNFPRYMERIRYWLITYDFGMDESNILYIKGLIGNNIGDILSSITNFTSWMQLLFSKTINFANGILKFLFGMIISIYILIDKENISRNLRRLITVLFGAKATINMRLLGRNFNEAFSKYFTGKFIESIIVGIICYIGLLIIGAPYEVLITLLVAITNVIPYIGPLVGVVVSTLIVLIAAPIYTLWTFIFLLVLQQFDGWVLGPKIIGDTTGVSPLLVIASLMVGGALFGFIGMLVSVPVLSVAKDVYLKWIKNSLKIKSQ